MANSALIKNKQPLPSFFRINKLFTCKAPNYDAMIISKLNAVKALRVFDDQDDILKKKAFFLYYFIWAALIVALSSLITTSIFEWLRDGKLKLSTLLIVVSLIGVFVYCLIVLTKGKFSLAANLLVLGSLIGI